MTVFLDPAPQPIDVDSPYWPETPDGFYFLTFLGRQDELSRLPDGYELNTIAFDTFSPVEISPYDWLSTLLHVEDLGPERGYHSYAYQVSVKQIVDVVVPTEVCPPLVGCFNVPIIGGTTVAQMWQYHVWILYEGAQPAFPAMVRPDLAPIWLAILAGIILGPLGFLVGLYLVSTGKVQVFRNPLDSLAPPAASRDPSTSVIAGQPKGNTLPKQTNVSPSAYTPPTPRPTCADGLPACDDSSCTRPCPAVKPGSPVGPTIGILALGVFAVIASTAIVAGTKKGGGA